MTAPDNPTGADLVAEIRDAVAAQGITLNSLLLQLTTEPKRFLGQLAIARRPKPHTIARIRAAIAGEPVPPLPGNNFQRVAALRAEAADEAREREERFRQARTLSGTTAMEAASVACERRLANINSAEAVSARVAGRAANYEDLAARIERDQAARRAERERWLVIEQQRYALPRRGRLLEDMPA